MIEEHKSKIQELKSYQDNLLEEQKTPRTPKSGADLKEFELKLKETIEMVMKVTCFIQ